MSYDPQSLYASSWEKLLSQPEDQWFDRKSFKIQPKDLAKALVAFANAEGGIIAVGITDRTLDGLPSAKQANQLRQAPHEFTDPTTRYKVKIVDIPDPGPHSSSTNGPAQIYLFHVFPTENVHYTTAGECYLRVGDQTQKLKADDILELRYTKGEQTFDSTEVSGADVVDLDDESVASYAHSLGSSTPIDALRRGAFSASPTAPLSPPSSCLENHHSYIFQTHIFGCSSLKNLIAYLGVNSSWPSTSASKEQFHNN